MPQPEQEYVKLLVARKTGTQDKYLIARRATADYYGWTKQFPIWRPKPLGQEGGMTYAWHPGGRGELRRQAGTRLIISQTPSTAGWPTGKGNAFKVSNNCTQFDLAEIAHFVDVDWYWMETIYKERRTRAQWEEIYQSGNSRVRGGLVSA